MTVPAGQDLYRVGRGPCSGTGVRWTAGQLDAAIGASVAAVLFDDEGTAAIDGMLAEVARTEAARASLRRALARPARVEDWRVGEAIAESYLRDHRSCTFPWPDARDERKRGCGVAGADLVGFGVDDAGDCLAFAEVKTSTDAARPPGAMYGRTGLKQQLADLRDNRGMRDDLVQYLGHRAARTPWRHRYLNAAGRYLADSSDVRLFGVLVRDAEPHEDDLRARVAALAAHCPRATRIELLALYLPLGSIDGLGRTVLALGGGTKP